MSYEVTATRRRPQRFEDLAGQEFVVATLKNSIESGKIAHAYLFSGPRGCGKTSSARILAKALNCETGTTSEPCGKCTACQEITKGSCLDVIEIDGASNTSVNDIRQIKDEILFPPNSLRYKIYIIDEVHLLSTSAFTALLKTIEEPPPYVIFIFATTELHKVPATIKSRCQQFNFRLVAPEKVKELLKAAATESGIEADDEALYWIARETTGSVRDAYTLFDQVAAFSGNHITYEKIRDKMGITGVEQLNEICEKCLENNDGDFSQVFELIDSILQKGVSVDQLIINFTDYLRNLLLIKSGISKESLLGQSASRFSQKVLQAWDTIKLERALSYFVQLYRDVRYSLSPRYELELAVSRLCWLSSYISPREVKAAVDSARHLLAGGSVPQPETGGSANADPFYGSSRVQAGKTAAETEASESFFTQLKKDLTLKTNTEVKTGQAEPPVQENTVTRESIPAVLFTGEELWEKAIAEIQRDKTLVGSALLQISHHVVTADSVVIYTTNTFSKNKLQDEKPYISSVFKKLGGEKINCSIVYEEEKSVEETQLPKQIEIICDIFKGVLVS